MRPSPSLPQVFFRIFISARFYPQKGASATPRPAHNPFPPPHLRGAPGTRQELDMRDCWTVPAEAWRQLRDARWEKLRKADLYACLGRGEMFFGFPAFCMRRGGAAASADPLHMGPFPPGRTAGPGVSTETPRAQRGPAASSPHWHGAASSRTRAEQREVQGPDDIMPCMPRFLKHISSRVPKGPCSKGARRWQVRNKN